MRTALTFKERPSGGVVGGWGQVGIGGYIYIGLASCQPIIDLRNLQKLKEGGPWPLIPEFPKLQQAGGQARPRVTCSGKSCKGHAYSQAWNS